MPEPTNVPFTDWATTANSQTVLIVPMDTVIETDITIELFGLKKTKRSKELLSSILKRQRKPVPDASGEEGR